MNNRKAALQALDTQLGLINYYKSEEGQLYMQSFMRSVFKRDTFPDGKSSVEYADETAPRVTGGLVHGLNGAATYVMTDDMMSLTLKAGETVPQSPFELEDLPTRTGFCVLPRPIITYDIHGKRMAARAFAWWTTIVINESPLEPETRPAIIMHYFTNKHDTDQDDYYGDMRRDEPEAWLGIPEWTMCHWQPLAFGAHWWDLHHDEEGKKMFVREDEPFAADEIDEASSRTMREWSAFLKTFFLLVKQRVAVLHTQQLDRAHARRFARNPIMPEYGDIQIVTLRKERPTDQSEVTDGTPVTWSHRWMVSGHWRHQWIPSKGTHEDRFIQSYEKGPEHLPLIIKDKVFVWKQ